MRSSTRKHIKSLKDHIVTVLQWHLAALRPTLWGTRYILYESVAFISVSTSWQPLCCTPYWSNTSNVLEMSGRLLHGWPCELRWPSGLQTGARLIKGCLNAVNFCTCIHQPPPLSVTLLLTFSPSQRRKQPSVSCQRETALLSVQIKTGKRVGGRGRGDDVETKMCLCRDQGSLKRRETNRERPAEG